MLSAHSQAHRDFTASRLIRHAFAVRERLGNPRVVPGAKRPNSINRVLSGCSVRPNLLKRCLKSSRNREASFRCWKPSAVSSRNAVLEKLHDPLMVQQFTFLFMSATDKASKRIMRTPAGPKPSGYLLLTFA